ncbi:MAG: hypothetical protein IT352_08165 [Gemmatimonadales bacterium]|nr:hypothetical protein [Gemmatimonadales bacterium]
MRYPLATLLGCLAMASACQTTTTEPNTEPRSFALGFTEFPYAGTLTAVQNTYAVIGRDADFVNHHFDGGVPWNEALDGLPFHPAIEGDLARMKSDIPAGHVRLISVSPVNFLRTGLADYRGATTGQPLPAPWDTASFDNPRVKQAFLAYCKRLIDRLDPDYFVYAIEANILADKSPAKWPAFLRLAEHLYRELKLAYPSLAVFPSIQLELVRDRPGPQGTAVADLVPFADVIAVSTYPYASLVDPSRINPAYYEPVTKFAPGKPFAIAETAWPAEPVTAPYPIVIASDPDRQRRYVENLLATLDQMDAVFLDYFFTRDYDDFWESAFKFDPQAPLFRIWKDTGLYAGDGAERPALGPWRAALARGRR